MAKFERVVLPFGEWAPDENFLSLTGNLDNVANLLRVDGGYSRIPNPSTVASVAANHIPSAAIGWSDEAGANRAAVGMQNGHLFAVAIGGGTMTDRCKGGHYASGNEWDLVKFGPSVIATNNVDPVQLMNFGAASADLFTSATKPRGKYLCACRGHLILANISAPSANVRQFRWSALNAAANMEPGSNRSGFGELAGDAGVITGAQGFEDFFLIFTNVAVYRASYIGGADVWSLQQVGNFHDALPEGFSETIVPVGRDAYYLGRSGPKIVVNGEAVEDLGVGKVRRFLMDDARNSTPWNPAYSIDTTIPYADRAWATHDGFHQLIYWGWKSVLVAGNYLVLYAYSLVDRSWALIFPEEAFGLAGSAYVGALFPRTGSTSMAGSGQNPGFGLCYVRTNTDFFGFGPAEIRNLNGGAFLNASVLTKVWRPSIPHTQIHAVRLLWRKLGTLQDPAFAITINGTVSLVAGSTQQDPRGFIYPATGPYSADEFVFSVAINEVGAPPSAQLRDFVGLELEITSEKSHS